MPLQRKINRTRSIARMKPNSGGVKSARPKMTPQPAGKGKPKATGRPGMKRVPAPAMTTNKKKVY